MGILRVNGLQFELPANLCGDKYIRTAVMHATEYVGVSIEGARFDFNRAAMQTLLTQLSHPDGDGITVEMLVQQAFEELRRHFEGEV